MKIMLINGSPRVNGATGTLLREAARHLGEKSGTTVELVDLGKLAMRLCTGCTACYRTGHCIIRDDGIEDLAERAKAADGLVIGTPTYGSNVSSHLKNFMDRGHFIMEQALYGKHCFSLATYEIADGGAALKAVDKFFLVAGGARVGKLLVKVRFGANPLEEPCAMQRLHHRLDRFHDAIRQGKPRSLFERVFNDLLVVRTIWRPHFRARPAEYQGILRLYRERGIHPACR